MPSPEELSSPPPEELEKTTVTTPPPTYVKLAMRNMVKKKGVSLKHFFLTTMGLLGVLLGLAYLTR